MVDLGYAYANARVKGMKSNLLGSHVFRELMQVRTVDEVIALLEQTPYKKDLVEASRMRSGVQLVDVALSNNLARTIATMGRIMPKHASGLFSLLTADWERLLKANSSAATAKRNCSSKNWPRQKT